MWGLPPNSRVMRFYSKSPVSNEVMLLATMADRLSFIAWTKTKDAEKGRNRPPSILEELLSRNKKQTDLTTYNSAAEYEAERRKLLEDVKNGKR